MHLIDVQLGLPDAVPCGPRAVSGRGMTCLGKVAPHLHHGSAAANENVSGVGKKGDSAKNAHSLMMTRGIALRDAIARAAVAPDVLARGI
jgi:hypothetical protein